MTYDPYRNGPSPQDPNGNYTRDPDSGGGAGILLVLTLLVLGGFIYYFSSGDNTRMASNMDLRTPITQPNTTGAAPRSETTGVSDSMTSSPTVPTPAPKPAE